MMKNKKTILHVEDRGEVTYYLRHFLKKEGYRVLNALDTEDADILFEEHGDEIEYMILDFYLPKITQDNSVEAFWEGWTWLVNTVFSNHEKFKNKTIIFSDYLDLLQSNHPDLKKNYPKIVFIPKNKIRIDTDCFTQILEALKAMENNEYTSA